MAWTSSSVLKLLRTCHRHVCQTLSNAFLKSMKLWKRSRLCYRCFSMMTRLLKICSTVLRPGLKPACSSTSSFSALAWSQMRISRSMVLLWWLIRLMVQCFWQCLWLSLFGKGMTSDCVRFFGHFSVCKIFLHITVRTATASPLCLSNSEEMLFTHGYCPAFRLSTTSSTSPLSTGML